MGSRRGKRYDQPGPGEWVQPVRKGYKLCCCDCGLVHRLDFRIVEGRVQFRAFRANRSTAMIRRHMRAKGEAEAMPTVKGYSRKSIGANIKAERAAGKSKAQSIAIALNVARKAAKAAGHPEKGPSPPRRKRKKR